MKILAIVPLVPSGACQQTAHNHFQRCLADDRLAPLTTLEHKPALIEAIEHLDARRWVLHALLAEQRLPLFRRHRLRTYRVAEQPAENRGQVLWRYRRRALQLDDAAALPLLAQEPCRCGFFRN